MESLRHENNDRIAAIVEQNKANYIQSLSEKVQVAIHRGHTSASISKTTEPRFFDGDLATFEAVSDHFAENGFESRLDRSENKPESTYSWLRLTVDWSKAETTDTPGAI